MDDRRRDGGTNSTLRTKEQGTHLTLNKQDDDDDDDDKFAIFVFVNCQHSVFLWVTDLSIEMLSVTAQMKALSLNTALYAISSLQPNCKLYIHVTVNRNRFLSK